MMRELHIGYKELRGARIRVSPDGRRALLLGNQGSIFLLELSTRTAGEPHQLASAIVDGCFYDNDTCYFVGGRGGWEDGRIEDSHIVEYDLQKNSVRANYWDKDLFGAVRLEVNGNYMAIG